MSGEKTEKATPKKLKDLRKKGTVARSVELPQGVVLVAAVALLPGALSRLSETVTASMAQALSSPEADLGVALTTAASMVRGAVGALGPLLAALVVVSLVASAALTRSMPNPSALRPQKERISAKAGIKRLVSAQVVFELLRSIVKLSLLTAVTIGVWKTGYAALMAGPGTVSALTDVVGDSIGQLLVRTALLAFVVGLVDAKWSRRRFDKQAKMSHHDLREESKSSEGNPLVKGQIRARQSKLSRSRMLAAVAGADVVLANPTHLVVALSYTDGSGAPVVVAKGAGGAADRIKVEAAKHDVPVVADKPLARALYRAADVGDPIPVEFYRAVAEVLATIYSTRRRSA